MLKRDKPTGSRRIDGSGEVHRIGQYTADDGTGYAFTYWVILLKGNPEIFQFKGNKPLLAVTKPGDRVHISTIDQILLEFVNESIAADWL